MDCNVHILRESADVGEMVYKDFILKRAEACFDGKAARFDGKAACFNGKPARLNGKAACFNGRLLFS